MQQLADGVWQLKGFPPDNVNVYVLGDVLIDAGQPWDALVCFGHGKPLRDPERFAVGIAELGR